MKTIQITKYISDNGVQFDNENDCIKYEETLKNVKYFAIVYCPDSNDESYQKRKLVIVNADRFHDTLILSTALKLTEGKTLHLGYGGRFFPEFKVNEISLETFEKFKNQEGTDKYVAFISNEKVLGFPENYIEISELL